MKKVRESKTIIVTLDLYSNGKGRPKSPYRVLDKLMTSFGFSHNSPKRGVKFPDNTYYGTIFDTVKNFREKLWRSLKENSLHPTALFGGELRNWGTKRIPKKRRTPPRMRVGRRIL